MEESRVPDSVRRCRTTAVMLLILLFAAPAATHAGVVPYTIGLALTALAVLGSALLLCGVLVMAALARFRAQRARLGVIALVAVLPVLVGISVVVPASGLPVIHDISTDLEDPPAFEAALALRGPDANPLARGTEIDAAQRAGYPELRGIETPLGTAEAFARAVETARSLGWQIHATDPARGVLEASETTFWFGFTDDVAVRVRPHGEGSRIDLRSVSRVGRGDLGANASRIARFVEAYSSP